jgi:hypothetical protein
VSAPNARLTGAHKAYPERCGVSASALNLQLELGRANSSHEFSLQPRQPWDYADYFNDFIVCLYDLAVIAV